MDKYAGKRLDARYEIYELLGVGGMAFVYRAYDLVQEKIVALKILKDDCSNNNEFIRRFRTESKAIKILNHPNIVKVFDINIGSKIQYAVMEYLNGKTLREYIDNQREIDIFKVLKIVTRILEALKHAHDKGIVHRDIKPKNIMIIDDDKVKVMDFGIARFFKNETKTIDDKSLGSVHYLSPEQARGDSVDIRSDVYSVGIIMYEMLTKKLPFEAKSEFSVALMQMQLDPKRPSQINENIPPFLEKIILKSMKKNLSKRYQNVDQILKDIRKFEENSDINFNDRWLNSEKDNTQDEEIESNEDNINDDYNYNNDIKNDVIIPKKKKAVLVAAGIFVTFVVFALAFMFTTTFTSYGLSGAMRDVDIPDFVGMHLSDVEKEDYKFHWKIESVYDPSKPQGIILAQEPISGSKKVKAGSTIALKVNSYGILVEVPSLSGLSSEAGVMRLTNTGLKAEIRSIYSSEVMSGKIIHSDPLEGTKLMIDSTVVVYVSKGPEELMITVPDVIGKNLLEAKQQIIDSKLKFSSDIKYEKSDLPRDTIISTDPLPGVPIKAGEIVTVTASSGVRRDRIIDIEVLLPSTKEVIDIDVFVDGIHQQRKRVDPTAIRTIIFQFTGSSGKKEVRIKINDHLYRVYELNFDKIDGNNVRIIEMHDY